MRVLLPTALVRLFPGCESEVEFSAATVDDAIDALDRRWPGMADRLRDSTPSIRCHLNIFVDGDKADLATRLDPDSEMIIMTAISGGCLPRSSRL